MIFISDDLYLKEDVDPFFDLRLSRIGYISHGESAVATSTAAEYSSGHVLTDTTYDRWKPIGEGQSITIDLGQIRNIDYIGIAAHRLTGINVQVLASEVDADYELLSEFVPTTNDAIMLLYDTTSVRYVRITIAEAREIGVVKIGTALIVERAIYGGHSPGMLSRETLKTPQMSESGEYLGTSIIRKGYVSSFTYENLRASWYRQSFDPFVVHARSKPFFIAWRPATFPKEVLYAWTTEDISPSNMGVRNLMTVSFNARGYDER